jgi:sugar-specific transcriptional regulator TrmB
MSKKSDKTEDKEILQSLGEFGLTVKEAQVYLALLPRRDVGSSKLSQAAGLHRQFVYDALQRLEELGLAQHVIQNGRKKFSANTPNRLLSLVEEKRVAVQSVAKKLQSRFAGQHEQSFEVYQGDNAFMAHQIELMKQEPEGSVIDVIASHTERFSDTFRAVGLWDEFEKIRRDRKLHTRYLGSAPQRERLEWREKNEPSFEYRILPGLFTGMMSMEVRTNSITFTVYGNELLDFTLSGKEIADGYRSFFQAVWDVSTK